MEKVSFFLFAYEVILLTKKICKTRLIWYGLVYKKELLYTHKTTYTGTGNRQSLVAMPATASNAFAASEQRGSCPNHRLASPCMQQANHLLTDSVGAISSLLVVLLTLGRVANQRILPSQFILIDLAAEQTKRACIITNSKRFRRQEAIK